MSCENEYNQFQEMLFKYSLAEFCCIVGVNQHYLRDWRKAGFISFDIDIVEEFEQWQVVEVFFVKHLIQAEISLQYLMKMFKNLRPPYCYSHKDIYWDFSSECWCCVKSGEYFS